MAKVKKELEVKPTKEEIVEINNEAMLEDEIMLARIIINYSINHTARKRDFLSWSWFELEVRDFWSAKTKWVFLNWDKIWIKDLLHLIREWSIVNFNPLSTGI